MAANADEIVARGGLSTRPRRVRGANYLECCTRDALVDVADQIRDGFVVMNVEHLSFLPPIGVWHRADVEDDSEGYSELVTYGRHLEHRQAQDGVLQHAPDDAPEGPRVIPDVSIRIEPRNFAPEVWQDLSAGAPLPATEHAARSSLPPLIWVLSIPVTWGLAAFSGSFLKRLGSEAADGLVEWLRTAIGRARGSDRDSMVKIDFEVGSTLTVSAYVPLGSAAQANVDSLRNSLEALGPVASYAGSMSEDARGEEVRLAAFFYQNGDWHLGWWATPEAAHLTSWFQKYCPDPRKFLNQPHLATVDQNATDPSESLPLIESDPDDR